MLEKLDLALFSTRSSQRNQNADDCRILGVFEEKRVEFETEF